MLLLSFGSPLMEFVPNISGGVYHLCSSESGYGKTTGQWGGASVWGNPKELVLDGDDTTNTLWNRAEVYKNLPLYVDEATNIPGKTLSDFLYRSTAGKQRGRMSSAGQNKERYRGSPWSLLVGTSANVSLLDTISSYRTTPKGEMQRVFETRVKGTMLTSESTGAARELNEALSENYGVAAVPYMQEVIKTRLDAKKDLSDTMDRIVEAAGLTPQNRIWTAQAAAVLNGGAIAQRIGLIDENWDLENLFSWIISKFKRMKAGMKDMDIDIGNLIAQYYADNNQAVLRIKSTDDARNADPSGLDTIIMAEAMPKHHWVARHEYDINKIYLMVKPFKEWCVKQGFHYEAILEMVYEQLGGAKEKVRMGKGTTINLPPMTVITAQWDIESQGGMSLSEQPLYSNEADEDSAN